MPLQKSYSERIGLPRQRSPWQRSHSHPNNLQPANPKNPIPISEATKKKLNKFLYNDSKDESAADKGVDGRGKGVAASALNEQTPSHLRMIGNNATPVTRLDWSDLLEPCSQIPEEDTTISPNDKLLWNNKQDPNAFATISPMMPRKGRKRARSSSPISSPSADRIATPTVNVKKLAKALKSPHPDPTLELWDRYSLNGQGGQSPASGAANPILAQLMVSSSPRPSKNQAALVDQENLRRAASCGFQWPKRRRMEKSKSGSQVSASQRELEAASKSSLVTALLDSVTSSMQNQSQEDDTETGGMDSPSLKKRQIAPPQNNNSPSRKPKGRLPSPIVSDYGDDDDLDDEFLMLEETMLASQATQATQASQTTESVAPAGHGTERAVKQEGKKMDKKPALNEFDDFDDDDFDEADDLLASLELKTPASGKRTTSRTVKTPLKNKTPQKLADLEDEFGDDAFDGDVDFEAVEFAATQAAQQQDTASTANKTKIKTIQRYLVTSVLDGEYVDQYNRVSPEKILLIQADGSKSTRTVQLRGSWYDTPAHPDAYVHVIGEFSFKGQCVVDDAHNLLILHPDQLVSATVVADSFGCTRRAVLQDRVKATSEASPPLVYGTMLHEIFQEALLANRFDLGYLSELIEKNIERHIEDLYTIKMGIAAAKEHLQSKMTELSYWAKSFVASQPQADAIVEGRNGDKATIAVRKLLDVEEHVWSPMYGLKGNIDATVEVMMTDGKQSQVLTVPFEVKTGKHANSSHMAQTALYTLLLSDRYDIDITHGILYYMETSKTMRIPAIRHELRHMIMQRNQLACYIRERSVQLPPMLKSKHMCGKCYAKTSCFIYHRLADDGNGETSGMNEKFNEVVKHLTQEHQEFFIKWENLLTKEEKEGQKTKRELWTMTSSEREKKSRCFSDVIIEEGSASVDEDNPRINRFHYTFIKREPMPDFTFIGSELTVGEPIVVSDEDGHYALAIGYITSVRKQRISVAVDRRLHNARIRQPGFDELDNQVFASIMEVAHEGASVEQSQGKIKEPPVRYRLDQDEFSNGMATVRNNLIQMMANDVPAAVRIRELIVDLEPPRFKPVATQYTVTDGESLNVDQQRAIEKVMSAQDYALVLGMPGTGKTTTIAHIIKALVSQNKTVLLTSHTHTAVDNILLKLKSDKIPILRLGAPAKVHPDVQHFAHLAGQPKKTFEEIKEAWHGTPIVATTCLGINHQVFIERSFDYCIVDEASQITLPICAGPIRLAKTFVLVGDHNQLPPVVKNEEARQGGLDVSLFKLLSDRHPQSVVNLEHQYRMCEDIMTLSNTLIYNGRLRCGTEQLRKMKLQIPNMESLRQHHHDPTTIHRSGAARSFCTGPVPSRCWLYDLLDAEARVRFVDTDTIRPLVREEAQGKRIINPAEGQIVSQLVESLLTVGVPATEIGVMTHYRAQLHLLKDKLKHFPGIEMHTTDRFQGRDKEVIVLSLVRSNEACSIGDLLKDWRRINVAFTRAKTKLLVVGSMSTLKGSGEETMLSKFISLMEDRSWIYHMPQNALESHCFADLSTQLTGFTQRTPRKSPKRMPAKASSTSYADKENRKPSPRRARMGEGMLLKGKLITRDILNEMTDGAY
ncbi:DNA replication ATP-dependent helicase/nuclease DNA2 [Trichoderma asperellum]|uniref:DNA replication ATP-dependent helicase/nuclease n=1 Tax=Trichoderma asperellum TaxID=101201 RepID=A0A6V8R5R2_TRIAP|nr:DNA replication ATP-dependent helicase/nuclease DNA2 [Trichoderma asperellum]